MTAGQNKNTKARTTKGAKGSKNGHATPKQTRRFLGTLPQFSAGFAPPREDHPEGNLTQRRGDAETECPGWEKLRPKMRELLHRDKKEISKGDHRLVVGLVDKQVVLPQELESARILWAKYFPRELSAASAPSAVENSSAGSAPLREEPAAESITQRRGGAEKKEADEEWQTAAPVVLLLVDFLLRHEDNRQSSARDVEDLAASLDKRGQLEPIVVWQPPALEKEQVYQILSGETRWLAAKKLGWKKIQARVRRDLDAAAAIELLAVHNAQRQDLNPIQKARLMARLCQSPAEGGAGKTTLQVAELYGLQDGSSVSNLMRLLGLPEVWQERVASGELPESFARLLLPYTGLPPVMAELEKEWKTREGATDQCDSLFASRAALAEGLPLLIDQVCRCISAERWMGNGYRVPKIDSANKWVREQLGIVEIQLPSGKKGKLETVRVATNVKAFDELVAAQRSGASKAAAEKSGRDKPAQQRELSAAEKKQRAAERTRQLHARIADWRHKLLRRLVVKKMLQKSGTDSGFRLVIAYAAGPAYRGPTIGEILSSATGKRPSIQGARHVYWSAVAGCSDPDRERDLLLAMAVKLLECESPDWRFPTLPHALVEQSAAGLEVDVAAEWNDLQHAGGAQKPDPLLEELFLLHQTEELRALAREMGVHASENATRAGIIKLLLAVMPTRLLKLPKCIRPVAAVNPRGHAGKKAGKQKAAKGTTG